MTAEELGRVATKSELLRWSDGRGHRVLFGLLRAGLECRGRDFRIVRYVR